MPKKIVTSQYEGSYSGTNASHDPNSFVYDDAGVISYKDSENTPAQLFIKPGTFYGSGYDGGEIGGRPTIKLIPDIYASPDQHVVIDATEPDHIHIRAGGTKDASNAVLILGAENTNIEVSDMSGRVIINSNNGQFLQNSAPENQIATLGDISNIVPGEVSWTPVLTSAGGDFAQSSNPATGHYIKYGKMVFCHFDIPFSNVTNFGTGLYSVNLPLPVSHHMTVDHGTLHDVDANSFYAIRGHVLNSGDSTMQLWYQSVVTKDAEFDNNSPVTLTTDDFLHFDFTYETTA